MVTSEQWRAETAGSQGSRSSKHVEGDVLPWVDPYSNTAVGITRLQTAESWRAIRQHSCSKPNFRSGIHPSYLQKIRSKPPQLSLRTTTE